MVKSKMWSEIVIQVPEDILSLDCSQLLDNGTF